MVAMNPVKSLEKVKKYVNHQSAMANMSEMTTRNITNEFDKELTSDPNHICGFQAFFGEDMCVMAWNLACWCILTAPRTDYIWVTTCSFYLFGAILT